MKFTNPRRIRPQLAPDEIGYVHAVSRVVDRRFIMEEAEKGAFLSLVRRYEAFCCVRVVGYCLMSNHFHLLIEAKGRPAERPGEAWLLSHLEETLGTTIADQYRDRLELWRAVAKNSGQPITISREGTDLVSSGTASASNSDVMQVGQTLLADSSVPTEHTVQTISPSSSSEPSPEPLPAPAPIPIPIPIPIPGPAGLASSLSLTYAQQQYDKVLADIWQRMYSVSAFIQAVKQQFTCWYNKRMERRGTLWEERFSSTIVQGGAALAEIAAYIDLNPVRAGIVADPKDYRWSQYGAAVAGETGAQESVIFVAQTYASLTGEELADWSRAQGRYRILMYRRGLLRPQADGSVSGVFSSAEVERVYEEMGRLPDAAGISGVSYVGKRIRYFTEGVVIGARAFVNSVFSENRGVFGKNRKSGARKMRGDGDGDGEGDWGEMRSLRDLRKGISGAQPN